MDIADDDFFLNSDDVGDAECCAIGDGLSGMLGRGVGEVGGRAGGSGRKRVGA